MSQNFKLRLIAKAAALILPVVGFTLPAQSEQPDPIIVHSAESNDAYVGLVVRQVDGNGSCQNIYSLADRSTQVEYGPGESGYRGPCYQVVKVDGEGNETYTGRYFIIPLTGKPLIYR